MKSIKPHFIPNEWCFDNQHKLNKMLGQVKNKHSSILYSVFLKDGLNLIIYEALNEIN